MDSQICGELSSSATSASMMRQIRSDDPIIRQRAWTRFAKLYVPMIWEWCRNRGMQPHDAHDVGQTVFAEVFTTFDNYRHEEPLREWLWAITRRKVLAHYRNRARGPRAAGGTNVLRWIHQLADKPPPEPLVGSFRHPVLVRALSLIRADFDKETWQAFQRMVCDGQPAKVVAGELGWGADRAGAKRVRQAKYRILKRLREEFGEFITLS